MHPSLETDYFKDRACEFFAWFPVKTSTGWAIWTDIVEVWTFHWESGWEMHFEKLYAG